MPDSSMAATAEAPVTIDLKSPGWAALLAWLWPGAGHLYQGRTAKGLLFMVCILGTFFYGMYLGQGRVVHFGEDLAGGGGGVVRKSMQRLPFVCQIWAGLPALPALLRARTGGNPQQDLFHWSNWYVPPRQDPALHLDELHAINRRLHRFFELGTVFTMIAGFLNVLAIYDAWGGPAYALEKKEDRDREQGTGDSAPGEA
jgi:hypothetical protein